MRCGVEEEWHNTAQDRRVWQCTIREGAQDLNKRDKIEDQKSETRQRRENRLVEANAALKKNAPNQLVSS